MDALKFLKDERKKLRREYLKKTKEVCGKSEEEEIAKIRVKIYREYRDKDYPLECLETRLENILEEIEFYKENK